MSNLLFLDLPDNFSFRHTVYSHGWSELLPFELDEEKWQLSYIFSDPNGAKPVSATIVENAGRLRIETDSGGTGRKIREKLLGDLRHILRLDEDLSEFYELAKQSSDLAWIAAASAGRLIRSATVFEDLIKTICTTNCSWGLTRNMVGNLVDKLGDETVKGKRTFPTPEVMALQNEQFYRDEIRAGYRAPYLAELSESVAAGKIDPECWLESDLPTAELKTEIKKIKGVGDYAAENLLKLVGRYEGLALDSWLRSQFYKKHNREEACDDRKIIDFYGHFGVWRGLAIWCDMTERWHKVADR